MAKKTNTAATKYKRVSIAEYNAVQGILATLRENEQIEATVKESATKKSIPKVNTRNIEKAQFLLSGLAANLYSLRLHVSGLDDDDNAAVIQAVIEKCGWMADEAYGAISNGSGGVCGDFAAWANLEDGG